MSLGYRTAILYTHLDIIYLSIYPSSFDRCEDYNTLYEIWWVSQNDQPFLI